MDMTKILFKDREIEGSPSTWLASVREEWLAAIKSPSVRTALIYLALLVEAEILTTMSRLPFGMIFHAGVLIALLLHGTLRARGVQQRFLLSLALAPLIRFVSLGLPLGFFTLINWYVIVGAPLFLAAILAARMSRMNRKMLGLTLRALPLQLIIGLMGVGLGLIEWAILKPNPLTPELSIQAILQPALILLVFTGLLQEFTFRGVMQYASLVNLGRFGLIYVPFVFAVLHLSYRSPLDMIFVFAVALLFGWLVQRTGSILGVTLAHGMANIGLYLIFPFLLAPAKPVIPIIAPPDILAPASVVTPIAPALQPMPDISSEPTFDPIESTPTYTLTPTALPATETPAQPVNEMSPSEATEVAAPCEPPPGWSTYIVQPGDSLSALAGRYGWSVQALARANCLKNPSRISVGMTLWVPYRLATPIPGATDTHLPQSSATSTSGITSPAPPMSTQTDLPSATIPPTSLPTPTQAPEVSSTADSPTLAPTNPPTATPTPIIPTPTSVASETATNPIPTNVPTELPSVTAPSETTQVEEAAFLPNQNPPAP